jgi:hypothetical protein
VKVLQVEVSLAAAVVPDEIPPMVEEAEGGGGVLPAAATVAAAVAATGLAVTSVFTWHPAQWVGPCSRSLWHPMHRSWASCGVNWILETCPSP